MITKKFAISVILIALVAMLWNGLFHMVIIAEHNAMIANLRRPDIAEKTVLSLLMTIGIVVLFMISYLKWRRKGTLVESVLHGVFFASLAGILVNVNQVPGVSHSGKTCRLMVSWGII